MLLFQTLCQYKFDFLQEVCQHEHFIPLCLPIRSANIPGNKSARVPRSLRGMYLFWLCAPVSFTILFEWLSKPNHPQQWIHNKGIRRERRWGGRRERRKISFFFFSNLIPSYSWLDKLAKIFRGYQIFLWSG